MANIDTELTALMNAVYGEEVRSAFRDALLKMNNDVIGLITREDLYQMTQEEFTALKTSLVNQINAAAATARETIPEDYSELSDKASKLYTASHAPIVWECGDLHVTGDDIGEEYATSYDARTNFIPVSVGANTTTGFNYNSIASIIDAHPVDGYKVGYTIYWYDENKNCQAVDTSQRNEKRTSGYHAEVYNSGVYAYARITATIFDLNNNELVSCADTSSNVYVFLRKSFSALTALSKLWDELEALTTDLDEKITDLKADSKKTDNIIGIPNYKTISNCLINSSGVLESVYNWDVYCEKVVPGEWINVVFPSGTTQFVVAFYSSEPSVSSVSYNNSRSVYNQSSKELTVPSGVTWVAIRTAIGTTPTVTHGIRTGLMSNQYYISPRDYGGWGDGTHDDTSAIQTAFDIANDIQSSGIDAHILLDGQYLISSPIQLPDDNRYNNKAKIYVEGANKGAILKNNDFKMFDGMNNHYNYVFKDFSIINPEGNTYAYPIITNYVICNSEFINISFINVNSIIHAELFCQYIKFIQCKFIGASLENVALFRWRGAYYMLFDGCYFGNISANYIVSQKNTNTTYPDSTETHWSNADVVFRNCVMENFVGFMYLESSLHVQIIDNGVEAYTSYFLYANIKPSSTNVLRNGIIEIAGNRVMGRATETGTQSDAFVYLRNLAPLLIVSNNTLRNLFVIDAQAFDSSSNFINKGQILIESNDINPSNGTNNVFQICRTYTFPYKLLSMSGNASASGLYRSEEATGQSGNAIYKIINGINVSQCSRNYSLTLSGNEEKEIALNKLRETGELIDVKFYDTTATDPICISAIVVDKYIMHDTTVNLFIRNTSANPVTTDKLIFIYTNERVSL